MPEEIRVIIIDDETALVQQCKKKLESKGFLVGVALTVKDALTFIQKEAFDVAILGLRFSDNDRLEFVKCLKKDEPNMEIILVADQTPIVSTISRTGELAYDCLTRQCEFHELANVIVKAYEKKVLQQMNILLETQLERIKPKETLVGRSIAIEELKKLIVLASRYTVPVVVYGETGTGKEMIARQIHASSACSRGPFITFHRGSMHEDTVERELFGRIEDDFTLKTETVGLIEMAHNGTFFVDEISDISPSIQAKLVQLLKSGACMKLGGTREIKVKVRFIFATNKKLDEMMEARTLRKDLFEMINAFTLPIPSLRERLDDIPLLADYFVSTFVRGGKTKRISSQAIQLLQLYNWPGNVRELANVIERASLISGEREEIIVDDLPLTFRSFSPTEVPVASTKNLPEISLRLDEMEKAHLGRVLRVTGGNKKRAAQLLGISRKKLYRIIDSSRPNGESSGVF
jgi:DNA-binding NtrC family response regulator